MFEECKYENINDADSSYDENANYDADSEVDEFQDVKDENLVVDVFVGFKDLFY